jgi:integrase/recombinase XerD
LFSPPPAAAVRGPKYVVTKGKTPVLTAGEARALLDSIETDTLKGLRDRALIGVMAYTVARVGAVISLQGEDYFRQGKRWWFRLHEKGGKRHEVPAHHKAEAHVDAWMEAAGLADWPKLPLFRTFGRDGVLTRNPLYENDVLRMIKKRAVAAGLPGAIGLPHLSRYGHHRLPGKWRYPRKGPAHRRPYLAADDQTLRPHRRHHYPGRD